MPSLFDNIRSKFGPSVAATPKPPTRTDSGGTRANTVTGDSGSREEIQRRIELLRRMNNAYDTMSRSQTGGAHRPTPILARQQLQHPSNTVNKYRVRFREHIGSPLQQPTTTAGGHRVRAHYRPAPLLDYDAGDDSSAGPASPTEQYYSHVPEYASVNGRPVRQRTECALKHGLDVMCTH
jgi:hypothetical protein